LQLSASHIGIEHGVVEKPMTFVCGGSEKGISQLKFVIYTWRLTHDNFKMVEYLARWSLIDIC
jgi:hypothetical protein